MTTHVDAVQLRRYLDGDPAQPAGEVWAVEAHLERCADCRAGLAAAGGRELSALVEHAWTGIAPTVDRTVTAPPRRLRAGLLGLPLSATASLLLSAALIAGIAVALGSLAGPAGTIALVLLAPLVPLLAVSVAWSARLDPARELLATSPRAGLPMLLRRAAVALVPAVPVLVAASLEVGGSPLWWAAAGAVCTVVALALGSLVGVHRATAAVAVGWLVLAWAVLLGPGPDAVPVQPALTVGGLATVAALVVLAARHRAYGWPTRP